MKSVHARARGTVEQCIAEAREGGTTRLPTLNALAVRAGVSHVTMLACIHRMAAEGVLCTRRGSGVFLAGSAAGHVVDPVPRAAWRRVAEAVRVGVLDGTFARGECLPPRKELCDCFGVCPATLRRSLQWLSDQQVLEPDRKRHRVARVRGTGVRSTVVVITVGTPSQPIARPTQRHADDLLELERAITRSGLLMKLTFFWYEGEKQVSMSEGGGLYPRGQLDNVLGFVVLTRGLLHTTVVSVLGSLALLRRPVAVIDDTDEATRAGDWPHVPQLQVFTMANSAQCGSEVGRRLLDLGHRQFAYVGPEAVAWSHRRYEGLCEAVAVPGSTRPVCRCELPVLADRMRSASGADSFVELAVAGFGSRGDSDRRVLRALRGNAGRAANVTLTAGLEHEAYVDALGPPMERLLASPRPSVLVGGNDRVALACMEVLQRTGARIPEDISVVGFDDTFEAFNNGLTSYNFNSAGAAQAALNHVLSPPRPRVLSKGSRLHALEVKGFVNVRASTCSR